MVWRYKSEWTTLALNKVLVTTEVLGHKNLLTHSADAWKMETQEAAVMNHNPITILRLVVFDNALAFF